MLDEALSRVAMQKLLDFQMPTGEWGYYEVDFRERYSRVQRQEYVREEFLRLFRKPNCYRTLTAMEILTEYTGNMFNTRLLRSTQWIKKNLWSGWFTEWDQFVSGQDADSGYRPDIEKAPDLRHTSQTLLVLLKFDRNPGHHLAKGLSNIVREQRENGMWPRKPNFNGVEIFRSVCCADLLFHATQRRYRKKLTHLDIAPEFFPKARLALDRCCAWLMQCLEDGRGLWQDEYQTAMVLERLGRWFLGDSRYADSVQKALECILNRVTDRGWTNSRIADGALRESDQQRYKTTVRVCASLSILPRDKISFADDKLVSVRDYLKECFEPEAIDASDFRYFLQIFCPDPLEFRRLAKRDDFFDWLDVRDTPRFSKFRGGDALLKAISIWVVDCLSRLEKLLEGKRLGLRNYDQAFLEKEEELLEILEAMRRTCAGSPLAEFPAAILQYFQNGDSIALHQSLESALKNHSRQTLEPATGKKEPSAWVDILTSFFAKYAAEMSKS